MLKVICEEVACKLKLLKWTATNKEYWNDWNCLKHMSIYDIEYAILFESNSDISSLLQKYLLHSAGKSSSAFPAIDEWQYRILRYQVEHDHFFQKWNGPHHE